MTSLQPLFERNQEATVYVGGLDTKMTEDLVWELFTQCGPVVNVHLPRDKITGDHVVSIIKKMHEQKYPFVMHTNFLD